MMTGDESDCTYIVHVWYARGSGGYPQEVLKEPQSP